MWMADESFINNIVSKNSKMILGVVNLTHSLGVTNSNCIPAEMINNHVLTRINELDADPPLTTAHINQYSIPTTTGSGVGLQVLTKSQEESPRGNVFGSFSMITSCYMQTEVSSGTLKTSPGKGINAYCSGQERTGIRQLVPMTPFSLWRIPPREAQIKYRVGLKIHMRLFILRKSA